VDSSNLQLLPKVLSSVLALEGCKGDPFCLLLKHCWWFLMSRRNSARNFLMIGTSVCSVSSPPFWDPCS
jgi:hypothetical protein